MKKRSDETLHVGCPNLGDRKVFDKLVDEMFDRRWFTNSGIIEQRFEKLLCEHLNVKHCIPVCNATVGLQLAFHALDLKGEVITPAFTFVATPHAAKWEGLTPVFADIDPETHTLCPDSIRDKITDQTTAIVGVHVWGQPCDTSEIEAIAREHNLKVIYDAAHAFSCAHDGRMIGNFGDCEVFSFHATKFFNTFEGGAIATSNDELAARIRLMKNFGFKKMDQVVHLGTNAKMTEICAAMGVSVFANLDQILDHNRSNYNVYQELFDNVAGIRLFPLNHLEKTNWQYVVIEIDQGMFGCSRDQVFNRLLNCNIRARRYFFPGCHQMEPYRSEAGIDHLPATDRIANSVLCLPTGTAVTANDVRRICHAIIEQQNSTVST